MSKEQAGTNQIIKQLSKYFTHEITENEEQEKTQVPANDEKDAK